MSVVKLSVNKRVAEALGMSNAGSSFGAFDGGTWKTTDVDEAILSTDGLVVAGICLTPGHSRRKDYEAASNTAHGALIATHLGSPGAVTFAVTSGAYAGTRTAIQVIKQEIEIDNLNPQALTRIPPKYAIEGGRLFSNSAGLVLGGASSIVVSIDICTYTLTTACQAPDEAYDADFHGAMGIILKDGQHEGAAAAYRSFFQQDLILLGVDPQIASLMTTRLDERTNQMAA